MTNNLKSLLVIMVLALAVFAVSKPICLRFMTADEFIRRRNVWIALTITAFLSPSFWLYAFVALPLMYWAGRKDSNPVALYLLLLHVIPPYGLDIPAVLVNEFFALDSYRILAFSILIPTAWRLFTGKDKSSYGNHKSIDRMLWAYFGLQLLLLTPYESVTNTLRRGFLMVLDVYVLVYVVSRACNDRRKITEAIASFCLACAIYVPIAAFESQKVWLLYTGLATEWNIVNRGTYLMRDGMLRAQVSAGHSLALGYLFAVASGLWLYLSVHVTSGFQRVVGYFFYWVGLLSALSRAPWLTAVFAYFVYFSLNKDAIAKISKTLLFALPIATVLLLSPIGPKIIDKLPFIGTVDADNVEYRQRLADSSWQQIKEHPFFGNPFFLTNLENMRQGEGIIDLVNVYASISMLYGVVGLILFLSPFFIGLQYVYKNMRASAVEDNELSLLGAGLVASLLGTAFFMATGSFYGTLPKIFYLLIGLSAAYGQLKQAKSNHDANGDEKKRAQFTPYRK